MVIFIFPKFSKISQLFYQNKEETQIERGLERGRIVGVLESLFKYKLCCEWSIKSISEAHKVENNQLFCFKVLKWNEDRDFGINESQNKIHL